MKLTATLLFFLTLAMTVMAQKTVAMLQTLNGDKTVPVKTMELNMVKGELTKAICNQRGYKAFTRVDVDQMMKEHGFQNSGMVADAQRKRLGEMTGASYICVSKLTKSNQDFYIEAYLIDVETGEISNPATQYGHLEGGTYSNLFQLCQVLAQELIGYVDGSGSTHGGSYDRSNSGSKVGGVVRQGQDYNETAFGINMHMVYVEGGSFNMGCTSEQFDCDEDENNVRRITLDGFYMGATEVTQSQWELVMGTNVYQQCKKHYDENYVKADGDDYPMCFVTWEEAMEFCHRLSEITGKTYILPSEAQWEYAARGGKHKEKTQFSGSNNVDLVCWCNSETIQPVATKKPNALGLYDMSGNVWELCYDWFNSTYQDGNTHNPICNTPYSDFFNNNKYYSGPSRVERGGGYWDPSTSCRVSNRGEIRPTTAASFTGFRVAMIP